MSSQDIYRVSEWFDTDGGKNPPFKVFWGSQNVRVEWWTNVLIDFNFLQVKQIFETIIHLSKSLNTVLHLQCLLYIEFLTSSGLLLHSVVSLSELEPVTLHGDLCHMDHIEVRYTMMAGYQQR